MATNVAVDATGLRELSASLKGDLIRPGDAAYDERRVWNGSIDRVPALIARCSGAADVMAAVRVAREQPPIGIGTN